MTERHVGDYRGMAETRVHDQWLPDEDGANRIANVLANAMDVDPPEIIFTGKTSRWMSGSANCRRWYIRLHQNGQDVGALIHSLAHLVTWRRHREDRRHGDEFKRIEQELVERYFQIINREHLAVGTAAEEATR